MNDILNDGMGFSDSSLFSNYDTIIPKEEYIEKIISLLKPILEHNFKDCLPRQQIKYRRGGNRITCACPVCGDSATDNYAKRGNIILEGKWKNHFKCFNCGKFERIDSFFRDYQVNLDLSLINYITKDISDDYSHENKTYDIGELLDMKMIESVSFERDYIKKMFNLVEVKGTSVFQWLRNRLQYDDKKFLYNESSNYLVICNLTKSGKIFGFQKRILDPNVKNKYNTYKCSLIHEIVKDDIEVSEEMNMMSMLFNICYVNFGKPITLLEGPFDSFLVHNAIANCGANKSFPIDLEIRYLFDNDTTGTKKALEKLNEGNKVFLWDKFLKNKNMPYRKKWDINDMYIWAKENHVQFNKYELDRYFSDDALDIMDV